MVDDVLGGRKDVPAVRPEPDGMEYLFADEQVRQVGVISDLLDKLGLGKDHAGSDIGVGHREVAGLVLDLLGTQEADDLALVEKALANAGDFCDVVFGRSNDTMLLGVVGQNGLVDASSFELLDHGDELDVPVFGEEAVGVNLEVVCFVVQQGAAQVARPGGTLRIVVVDADGPDALFPFGSHALVDDAVNVDRMVLLTQPNDDMVGARGVREEGLDGLRTFLVAIRCNGDKNGLWQVMSFLWPSFYIWVWWGWVSWGTNSSFFSRG